MVAFSMMDILRMSAGALLLSSFSSYWFTSSTTWGYNGRYLDREYYKFLWGTLNTGFQKNLTSEQLTLYNGTDDKLPVYISIDRKIYDVSANRKLYSPPLGRYSVLSGHECARMLATTCIGKLDELTNDLRGLDDMDAALKTIKNWQLYYESKPQYWFVGYLNASENHLDRPIPSPCMNPVQVPRGIGGVH